LTVGEGVGGGHFNVKVLEGGHGWTGARGRRSEFGVDDRVEVIVVDVVLSVVVEAGEVSELSLEGKT
jgi:hypothetical protein